MPAKPESQHSPSEAGARLYLVQKEIGSFLREHGIPIGDSTVEKECLPSVGSGPPVVGFWGKRPLYDPKLTLEWALSRITAQKQPTLGVKSLVEHKRARRRPVGAEQAERDA